MPRTLEPKFTIAKIGRLLSQSGDDLHRIAARVDGLYHGKRIPKAAGWRVLHIPSHELKAFQRELLAKVLNAFPVSDVVHSQKGFGVVSNARAHLAKAFMVALDVQDCFPSIGVDKVRTAFIRGGCDRPAANLLTRLVTYRGALPQGAPTSPATMNIVFADIDAELAALALQFSATYTRYADDLCFSSDSNLASLVSRVEAVLRRSRFRTNQFKRRVWGPHDRHTVTNIIVTTALNPSAEFLEALTSELHNVRRGTGVLTDEQIEGMLAWVAALNPDLARRINVRWTSARRSEASSHTHTHVRMRQH